MIAYPIIYSLVPSPFRIEIRGNTSSYERYRTKTRFETEAKGNSECLFTNFTLRTKKTHIHTDNVLIYSILLKYIKIIIFLYSYFYGKCGRSLEQSVFICDPD